MRSGDRGKKKDLHLSIDFLKIVIWTKMVVGAVCTKTGPPTWLLHLHTTAQHFLAFALPKGAKEKLKNKNSTQNSFSYHTRCSQSLQQCEPWSTHSSQSRYRSHASHQRNHREGLRETWENSVSFQVPVVDAVTHLCLSSTLARISESYKKKWCCLCRLQWWFLLCTYFRLNGVKSVLLKITENKLKCLSWVFAWCNVAYISINRHSNFF